MTRCFRSAEQDVKAAHLYVGATFTLRAHNYREAPWPDFHRIIDDLLGSYDVPAGFGPDFEVANLIA